MQRGKSRAGKIGFCAAGLLGGAGLLAGFYFAALRLGGGLMEPRVERHASDAALFHQANSARMISPPRQARLLSVEKTTVWIDVTYDVRFTLPNTHSPDQWVRQIWAGNRFAPGARQGPAHYEAYHSSYVPAGRTWKLSRLHHGFRSVEFLPGERVYRAVLGTD